MIDVSVIVPAFNDERLNDCCVRLNGLPNNYEWIVASEKGKGSAIVNAVKRARGNIIVTCDTDFRLVQFIPDYVKQFVDEKADILVGDRIYIEKPLSRRVSSKVYNFYKQVLFGALPDTQSGFKIFKKQALLQFENQFKIKGFAWDTEFISRAKDADLTIIESNITERCDKGTVRVSDGFGMIFDLAKLWVSNKYNLMLLCVSLTFLLGLILASALTSIPIGTDVHFHYKVAGYYAIGQNGMFSSTVLEMNNSPYPPIFHLMLVPSIWLNVQYLFAKMLQIVLPFLIYLSTIVFIRYYTYPKTELITALLLLSTMGFIDGTIQARPQGLAMIIIPFALFFYIQNKDNKFVASSGILAWTHGVAGIANIWLLTLYGFFKGSWKKTFIKLALVLGPIILITLIYLGGAVGKWGGATDTYQEYLIFTKPQEMIPYYSGMCLIGWVFLAYNLTRWTRLSSLEKTLTLSLVGLTVMIPLWADRFLQYSTLTLACISALGLSRYKRAQQIVLPLVVIMYVLVTINLFWTTFTNNWWLYPQ